MHLKAGAIWYPSAPVRSPPVRQRRLLRHLHRLRVEFLIPLLLQLLFLCSPCVALLLFIRQEGTKKAACINKLLFRAFFLRVPFYYKENLKSILWMLQSCRILVANKYTC